MVKAVAGAEEHMRSTTETAAILACILSGFVLTQSCNRSGTLQGEVFIVTKGGENVKLGLVQVRAFPVRETEEAVDKARQQAAVQRNKLEKVKEEASTLKALWGDKWLTLRRAGRLDTPSTRQLDNESDKRARDAWAAYNRLDERERALRPLTEWDRPEVFHH